MANQLNRTLTVSVASSDEVFARALKAAQRVDAGEGYRGEYRSFETLPLLFDVFSPKRWALIGKLREIGASSLRALARELGRDVKRVHEDVAVLLEEGIVERNADNKLFVPFRTININVTMDDKTEAA